MNIRILFLFTSFTITLIGYGKDKNQSAQTGDLAPNFVYQKNDSVTANFYNLKGKVTVINFFATWCPPCKKELPLLSSKIWNKHKENPNFELMIFGRGQNKSTIKEYTDTRGIEKFLPYYPDESKEIFNAFANDIIPRTYVIDQNGKIIFQSIGFNEDKFNRMVEVVDSLLVK